LSSKRAHGKIRDNDGSKEFECHIVRLLASNIFIHKSLNFLQISFEKEDGREKMNEKLNHVHPKHSCITLKLVMTTVTAERTGRLHYQNKQCMCA